MKNPFDTPERVAFRKTLRDFVAKEIKPNADTWDEVGEIPWDLHQRVGALGVWGFGIEEQYGGLGMDDCFMRAAYNEEFATCGKWCTRCIERPHDLDRTDPAPRQR